MQREGGREDSRPRSISISTDLTQDTTMRDSIAEVLDVTDADLMNMDVLTAVGVEHMETLARSHVAMAQAVTDLEQKLADEVKARAQQGEDRKIEKMSLDIQLQETEFELKDLIEKIKEANTEKIANLEEALGAAKAAKLIKKWESKAMVTAAKNQANGFKTEELELAAYSHMEAMKKMESEQAEALKRQELEKEEALREAAATYEVQLKQAEKEFDSVHSTLKRDLEEREQEKLQALERRLGKEMSDAIAEAEKGATEAVANVTQKHTEMLERMSNESEEEKARLMKQLTGSHKKLESKLKAESEEKILEMRERHEQEMVEAREKAEEANHDMAEEMEESRDAALEEAAEEYRERVEEMESEAEADRLSLEARLLAQQKDMEDEMQSKVEAAQTAKLATKWKDKARATNVKRSIETNMELKRIKALECASAEHREELFQLQNDMDGAVNSLQSKLGNKESEASSSMQKLKILESTAAELQTDLDDSLKKAADLSKEKNALESELTDTKDKLISLVNGIQDVNSSQNTHLRQALSAEQMSARQADAKERTSGVLSNMISCEKEEAAIDPGQDVAALTNVGIEYMAAVKESQTEMFKNVKNIESSMKEIQRLRKQETQEANMKQLEAAEEIDNLMDKIGLLEAVREEAGMNIKTLKQVNAEMVGNVNTLEEELQATKSRLAETESELRGVIERLQGISEKKVEHLEKQLGAAKADKLISKWEGKAKAGAAKQEVKVKAESEAGTTTGAQLQKLRRLEQDHREEIATQERSYKKALDVAAVEHKNEMKEARKGYESLHTKLEEDLADRERGKIRALQNTLSQELQTAFDEAEKAKEDAVGALKSKHSLMVDRMGSETEEEKEKMRRQLGSSSKKLEAKIVAENDEKIVALKTRHTALLTEAKETAEAVQVEMKEEMAQSKTRELKEKEDEYESEVQEIHDEYKARREEMENQLSDTQRKLQIRIEAAQTAKQTDRKQSTKYDMTADSKEELLTNEHVARAEALADAYVEHIGEQARLQLELDDAVTGLREQLFSTESELIEEKEQRMRETNEAMANEESSAAEIKALKGKITTLEALASAEHKQYEASLDAQQNLGASVTSLSSEFDVVKSELETTKKELEAAQDDLRVSLDTQEEISMNVHDLAADLETTEADLNKTKADLEACQEDLAAARANSEHAENEFEAMIGQLKEDNAQRVSGLEEALGHAKAAKLITKWEGKARSTAGKKEVSAANEAAKAAELAMAADGHSRALKQLEREHENQVRETEQKNRRLMTEAASDHSSEILRARAKFDADNARLQAEVESREREKIEALEARLNYELKNAKVEAEKDKQASVDALKASHVQEIRDLEADTGAMTNAIKSEMTLKHRKVREDLIAEADRKTEQSLSSQQFVHKRQLHEAKLEAVETERKLKADMGAAKDQALKEKQKQHKAIVREIEDRGRKQKMDLQDQLESYHKEMRVKVQAAETAKLTHQWMSKARVSNAKRAAQLEAEFKKQEALERANSEHMEALERTQAGMDKSVIDLKLELAGAEGVSEELRSEKMDLRAMLDSTKEELSATQAHLEDTEANFHTLIEKLNEVNAEKVTAMEEALGVSKARRLITKWEGKARATSDKKIYSAGMESSKAAEMEAAASSHNLALKKLESEHEEQLAMRDAESKAALESAVIVYEGDLKVEREQFEASQRKLEADLSEEKRSLSALEAEMKLKVASAQMQAEKSKRASLDLAAAKHMKEMNQTEAKTSAERARIKAKLEVEHKKNEAKLMSEADAKLEMISLEHDAELKKAQAKVAAAERRAIAEAEAQKAAILEGKEKEYKVIIQEIEEKAEEERIVLKEELEAQHIEMRMKS